MGTNKLSTHEQGSEIYVACSTKCGIYNAPYDYHDSCIGCRDFEPVLLTIIGRRTTNRVSNFVNYMKHYRDLEILDSASTMLTERLGGGKHE